MKLNIVCGISWAVVVGERLGEIRTVCVDCSECRTVLLIRMREGSRWKKGDEGEFFLR